VSFDIKSVPSFNVQEAVSGPVEIVLKDDVYYLYNDGIQWMSLAPSRHGIKEMYPCYELAYGDVLITGLGFGILALWLCSKPDVKSVTVIEYSPDVIEIFKKSNEIPEKLTILNDNAITFSTDKKYDCIFLDHYETQNFDWRLKNMQEFCDRIKHDVFWAWSIEEAYLFKTHKLDRRQLELFPKENYQYFLDIPEIASRWQNFVTNFLPNEKSLLDITSEKIEEYVYGYYNKPLIEYRLKNLSDGEL
jgi:spermidine synthase